MDADPPSYGVNFARRFTVNPTPAVRKAHAQQLRDYLSATKAKRGAIVYLTAGEVVWLVS